MKERRLLKRLIACTLFATLLGYDCSGQTDGFQTVAPGIEHLKMTRRSEASGPWQINLLRIDLRSVGVRLVHAMDEAVGLEATSSMARRYKATAAVNAGFFKVAGVYRGDPAGVLVVEGKLLSEPTDDRAAVGFINRDGKTQVLMGHLKFSGAIKTHRGRSRAVDGINRERGADELIVFTPEFHRTTLSAPDGIEIIVRRGRIVERRDGKGSSAIPSDGYVISASGKAREWAVENLTTGARAQLVAAIESTEQRGSWNEAICIVGGGPQLIREGRVEITAEREGIRPAFVSDRHPRTAIASLGEGKILIVTVDGRQPSLSVGMSLAELAQLLLEFGARDAINLDGGGSTTMVIDGRVVNSPSDQTGERMVSDAILFFPGK